MSYDFKSVPKFIIKEASSGSVDIIDDGNQISLYNNGDRWMTYRKDNDLEIREMYSSYDLAYGDVLVSGLGFGILALWLCSKPEVKSVTVVEISEDVISLFKESNNIPAKLNIINDSMITYNTDKEYDVLLLDHYERQTFDWRLKDISRICSRIKHKYFWAWSLEYIYLFKMYTNLDHQVDLDINKILQDHGSDLSRLWIDFMLEFFPQEAATKNISGKKINEYVYGFFNKEVLP